MREIRLPEAKPAYEWVNANRLATGGLTSQKKFGSILRDARGEQRLNDREVITHATLPGFRPAVKALFELPRPK
jgi:hypothetical protein